MINDAQWRWLLRDQLSALDRIAGGCCKTRQHIVRRAMAFYLRHGEGKDILDILEGREQIERGEVHDFDDVLAEIEAIIRGDGD